MLAQRGPACPRYTVEIILSAGVEGGEQAGIGQQMLCEPERRGKKGGGGKVEDDIGGQKEVFLSSVGDS